MFKIATDPQFTHEVTVQTPVDGGHRADMFKCRFRLVTDDHAEAFTTRGSDKMVGFLRKVIVRFEDIVDEDDKPLEYNDGLRDQVLTQPHARIALYSAYVRAVSRASAGN